VDEPRFRDVERRLWSFVGVTPDERWGRLPTGERVRIQVVGDGPPALFVHGGSVSGTTWATLAASLPGVRCLLLDRPGCGLSEPLAVPPTDLDAVAAYADRLVADVLDAFEIERGHVVATSAGGYFALRGAAAHPERVDRLVELSWPVGTPIEQVPFAMRIASVPGLGRLMARVPPTRAMARSMLRQVGLRRALETGRFTDEMLDWFVSVLRDTDTMANELRSLPRVITPVAGMNQGLLLDDELLARITAPVQLIWGSDDPNGGAEMARTLAGRLPGAELHLLDGAGHAPWIDEPDACADLIRRFLQGGGP
jgi:pimeloyl-ACP methyl ester carboxylesterase